jgi:S1-C subfamily serine protease
MIPCVCPQCHAKLQAPDAAAGKQVKCPSCKTPITVRAAANSAVQAARPASTARPQPAASKSAPGAVKAASPGPAAVGKSSASISKSKPKPQYDDVEIDDDDEPVRPKSKKKGKKAKSEFPWMLVGIGGGVGVLVLALVGTIMFFTMGSKTDTKRPGNNAVAAGPGANPSKTGENIPNQTPKGPDPQPEVVVKSTFLPPNGPLPATIAPETTQRVKKATVKLAVTMANGLSGEGSGFFAIDRNLIVTNAHVVGMLYSNEAPRSIDIVVNSGEPDERRLTGTILGVDHDEDLAVLRLIGDTAKLPPPLSVDHVSPLTELQEVYIFGFPLGSQLGKNITVAKSAISSIRKDNDGRLSQVQVNGGMHPGNSGGPVVDTRGNVIGVAVSGIRGTLINFAVPAEKVQALTQGRVLSCDFGYPYRKGTSTLLPYKLSCLDPLDQIKKVEIEYWTGGNDTSRPFNPTSSARRANDGAKQTAAIPYADGDGKTELSLPAVPAGQVLWAQPVLTLNSNQRIYGPAAKATSASSAPLDRVAANLAFNFTAAPERTLDIVANLNLQLVNGKQKFDVEQKLTTDVLETLTPRGAEIGSRLSVNKAEVSANAGGKVERPFSSQAIDLFRSFNYTFTMSSQGKLTEVGNPVWSARIPADIRTDADEVVAMLRNTYETTSITLPNKQTQPLETWTSNITMLLNAGRTKEPVDVALKCTFEGVRSGKEAFIRLDGDMRPRFRGRDSGAGKVFGHVIFDTERGFITKSQVTVRSEAEFDNLHAVQSFESVLTRAAGNPRGIKPPAANSGNSSNSASTSKVRRILDQAGTLKASDPPYAKGDSPNLPHQVVPIQFNSGKTYVIDLISQTPKTSPVDGYDPYLALENPAGELIAQDDDGAGNLNSRIVVKASAAGQFKIIVTAFDKLTADAGYKLIVSEVEGASPPVVPKNTPKAIPKKTLTEKKLLSPVSSLDLPDASHDMIVAPILTSTQPQPSMRRETPILHAIGL